MHHFFRIPSRAIKTSHFSVEDDEWQSISGRRLVDIDHYLRCIFGLFTIHLQLCPTPDFIIVEESYRAMISTVLIKCKTCDKLYTVNSENTNTHHSTKKAAVWGTLASGSSFAHTEELFAYMGVPFMSFQTYQKTEHMIYDIVKPHAENRMKHAVELEKQAAPERDEDGVPMTTIYFDGSWPLRSFGNNYHSQSGAAVILGHETKLVLFADTRNTFCFQHYLDEKEGKKTEHKCFLNYTGCPGSMEPSIIVAGINWVRDQGLKAKRAVGDGDTSTFDKIKDGVPYGEQIEKVECKNHKLKSAKKKFINVSICININDSYLLDNTIPVYLGVLVDSYSSSATPY